ncbi:hypothetical protein DDB_G0290395 [Dictyostelium discoideum AX4]|uniref:Uncharacterized protein n=1 Tax=Dictyostelium discoideum TaxID=44689 RepID=Q54G54_DICDI|nr:hypothetical protein DDB_G0290395 [Dictyostelium discoideum AX4]EAL62213.1 hypothetical protein DDB_G0290395 [Dictyostelium discoideum AX4]|eukprot:XP_635718.1 hypothetical protein DDB_G0290395 [Dictyostelium discoideum AX4]
MIRNSHKYMCLVKRTLNNGNIIFNSSITLINKNSNNKSKIIQYNQQQLQQNRSFSSTKQLLNEASSEERNTEDEDDDEEYDEDDDEEYDEDEDDENYVEETPEEEFDRELNDDLNELEDEIMDVRPPLYPEIKYELYRLHHDDPSFWDVKRLSQVFTLHPGRVVALLRFVEIEKQEIERGFPVHKELDLALAEQWGCRFHDDDLGEDDNQKVNDYQNFSLQKGVGSNARSINQNYLHQRDVKNKKNVRGKPDPIHQVPTKIPEAFDDQPIYFRGPTYLMPRKKNLVFVDTSRDPFTKKVNPDPMVLIQGIDGSLRTPSTSEKSIIINKVRPEKVKRDYNSILKRPLKYRLASQQYPKVEIQEETEQTEENQEENKQQAEN